MSDGVEWGTENQSLSTDERTIRNQKHKSAGYEGLLVESKSKGIVMGYWRVTTNTRGSGYSTGESSNKQVQRPRKLPIDFSRRLLALLKFQSTMCSNYSNAHFNALSSH